LPIAEEDPVERLRLINIETRERKFDHDADTLYAFFHAIGRFQPPTRGDEVELASDAPSD